MSLSEQLRALKELILHEDFLAEDASSRLAYINQKFPKLSPAEAQDLSIIDPQKLRIYTGTIYTGQIKILKNHFKMTLARLQTAWKLAYQLDLQLYDWIRLQEKSYPWKTAITKDLATNFGEYLIKCRTDLVKLYPDLAELYDFEFSTLVLKRAPLGSISAADSLPKESLAQMPVADCLEQSALVNSISVFKTYHYDVLAADRQSRLNQNLDAPQAAQLQIAAARNRLHLVRWIGLDSKVFRFLEANRAKTFKLEELAEVVVNPEVPDEVENYLNFFTLLSNLLEAGILIVPTKP